MKKLLVCLLMVSSAHAKCERSATQEECSSSLKSLVSNAKQGKEVSFENVCESIESDVRAASEEIAVLGVTIAVYKNRKNHNKEVWQNIIKKFTQWLKASDDDAALRELAQAIYDSGQEEKGINFKLNVSFDNGDCGEECTSRCSCTKRDEGVCVCSVMGCTDCCEGEEGSDLIIV